MTTKIPTEILIKILKNIRSTPDLYSSLLVNRIWCKVTIPLLWELALGQEIWANREVEKTALCIRTYISCMDTQARTLLIQSGFDLSSSPPQATFDYPSLTHKLIIDNLEKFISIYSQQIIGPDQDGNNNNYENEITKSRILFREICKLIINRCTFLDSFKMTTTICFYKDSYKNFYNYSDLIGSILKLSGAPKVFKKLESFTLMIRNHEIKLIFPLYESLSLICDNILNMNLSFGSHSQVELLAKLISVQKRLENLSIVVNGYLDCNLLFWAISNQKENLKSLRLKLMYSPPIGRLQSASLQELRIGDCYRLYSSDYLSLTSPFTQLSSFHYFHTSNQYMYPQKFVIKILETANTNLKNICLDIHSAITSDTFSAILNYCTKVTVLTLLNLSPEQVIAIFNNDFNELSRFSFDCGREMSDADELLFQMAENVPKSLETIEIGMGISSADSLRKFFEGWSCKGGGNKKIIVKRKGPQLFSLSDEQLKVIEEYGVQFDIVKYSELKNMFGSYEF